MEVRCLCEGRTIDEIAKTTRPAGALKKLFLAEDEEGRLIYNNPVARLLKECN